MIEFLLILGAVVIYFAPALVAAWVRHPQLAYIGGVNAALGVTVVGWAGALMWALRRRRVIARSYHGDMEMPRSFNLSLAATSLLVVGVAVVATIAFNRLQTHNMVRSSAPLYAAGAVAEPLQWVYADLDGVRVASIKSSNSPDVPAPYKGGPVTLSVTRGPDGAIVKLDADAELACSYAPTANSVEISFDAGPSQAFACAPAPAGAGKLLFDGDHSTAYLANPQAFLSRMKGVRHISVTAGLAGVTAAQPLEFDVPPGDPTVAPVQVATAAAAVPAVAMAAVSTLPAPADKATVAADDQAGERHHGHRRHHRRH